LHDAGCNILYTGAFSEAHAYKMDIAVTNEQQVAAVLIAKGRIAAATYLLRLRISTVLRTFLLHYNEPGDSFP